MFLYIRFISSFIIVAILLYFIEIDIFIDSIKSTDLRYFMAATLTLGVTSALGAWRWQSACQATTTQSSYSTHLRIQLIGAFFGQVLPTSIGVEAMRAWLYSKVIGSLSAATIGVLADRISGLMVLLLLVVACYPLQGSVVESSSGRAILGTLSLASLGCLILLFAMALPVGLRLRALMPIEPVRRMAAELRHSLVDPLSTAKLMMISLLIHATTLFALALMAAGLGISIAPVDLLVLIPPAFLLAIVPISIAGWGLRESAFVVLLGFVSVPAERSLAMSILFGIAMILVSLAGGVVWVRSGKPQPRWRR